MIAEKKYTTQLFRGKYITVSEPTIATEAYVSLHGKYESESPDAFEYFELYLPPGIVVEPCWNESSEFDYKITSTNVSAKETCELLDILIGEYFSN